MLKQAGRMGNAALVLTCKEEIAKSTREEDGVQQNVKNMTIVLQEINTRGRWPEASKTKLEMLKKQIAETETWGNLHGGIMQNHLEGSYLVSGKDGGMRCQDKKSSKDKPGVISTPSLLFTGDRKSVV